MTPGQLAYARDVIINPNYPTGQPRSKWDQLSKVAQWAWERNPTTFDEERTASIHEEILAGLRLPHSRIREANGTIRQWTYNADGTMAEAS